MASDKVLNVTEENFETAVLKSQKPILVDFWAPWCGPCKMISPLLDELAAEYDGRVLVAKVNVDENPGLAQRFGITSIPNLKVFKAGVEVDNIIGAAPLPTLKKTLDKHL